MKGHCGLTQSNFLDEIKKSVRWSVKVVIAKANEINLDLGGRNGGYFCLLEEGCGDFTIDPMRVGKVAKDNHKECIDLCREKVYRLFSTHLNNDHLLSSQSRDEDKEQYGGAVCVDTPHSHTLFFGFSGLSEMADEITMFLATVKAGCISMTEAKKLAGLSNNTLFLENDWGL